METWTPHSRIGILGGSFNPVHIGHLLIAQDALEQFELERVVFMPCATAPHKSGVELAPAWHRLAMLEAAIEGDLRFEVSDLEIRRGGISYTIDTVREWRAHHPETELAFILGGDSLAELHLWKEIGALVGLCTFVTLLRPGFDTAALNPAGLRLPGDWGVRLLANVRTGHEVDVSSSDIRHRLAEGLSIRYLVPHAVEMYIAEHGVFGR